jgi:hypothetical protein
MKPFLWALKKMKNKRRILSPSAKLKKRSSRGSVKTKTQKKKVKKSRKTSPLTIRKKKRGTLLTSGHSGAGTGVNKGSRRRSYKTKDLDQTIYRIEETEVNKIPFQSTRDTFSRLHLRDYYRVPCPDCPRHGSHTDRCGKDPYCRMRSRREY